ncbi:MAG TPA: type IX secretion system membrane protein PorP/SprF [Cytophagales bacterium]|nr:type IX secretion system membrane protein PorP/SprF [Cytophagales bacterium]
MWYRVLFVIRNSSLLRFFLVLIIEIFSANLAFGQQRQFFSQYMFNGLTINPAYAGNQKMLSAALIYRKQWVRMDGSPNTQTFAFHNATKKKKIGYGLLVSRDEIGVHRDLSVYGVYSYKIKLKKGTLAMGLQGGFNYLSSNYYLLHTDPDVSDPMIPSRTSVLNPNVGMGLFYSTKTAYIGLSVPFFINNKTINKKDIDAISQGTEERIYLLTAGKVFPLTESLSFKPSTLIRIQDEAPLGFDLNGNVMYYELLTVGVSYRTGRSLILLTELGLTENFRLGYSFDYAVSGLHSYNRGSHEIMLNYRINLTPQKCHTYF